MDESVTRQLVERTEAIVRQRMDGQAAGHGMDHVLRVLASARTIHAHAGGALEVVELAALLHDVGDAKFHDGIERSAEFARDILIGLGADNDLIEQVAHIVDNISFRKGVDASELSLEGKIVQDADRLDVLGACQSLGHTQTPAADLALDPRTSSSLRGSSTCRPPSVNGTSQSIALFHRKL